MVGKRRNKEATTHIIRIHKLLGVESKVSLLPGLDPVSLLRDPPFMAAFIRLLLTELVKLPSKKGNFWPVLKVLVNRDPVLHSGDVRAV